MEVFWCKREQEVFPMTEAKNRTKSQLELALRTLLREKPLSQIRVRELTEMCGIRRQSFY